MRLSVALLAAVAIVPGCASLHIHEADPKSVKITKGILRVPIGVLTLGLSEAWHARERAMESWLGAHESSLLMSWGPPTQVYPDGAGGRILVYVYEHTYVRPGYATTTTTGTTSGYASGNNIHLDGQSQSITTYTPPQVQRRQMFRQFRVSPAGDIVGYSWRGL